jgi:hypothetical protein
MKCPEQLIKTAEGWTHKSGEWTVVKGYRGYSVSHIPSGKQQACVGIKTLEIAVGIMTQSNLENDSYFCLPREQQITSKR